MAANNMNGKAIILARTEDAGRKWAADVGMRPLHGSTWADKVGREYRIVTQRHAMLGLKGAVFFKAGWVGNWLLDRAGRQCAEAGCRWATLDEYRALGAKP